LFLEADELRHLQDCDECCDVWWKLKVQGNLEAADDESKKKSA
jgi:hypothetical protein